MNKLTICFSESLPANSNKTLSFAVEIREINIDDFNIQEITKEVLRLSGTVKDSIHTPIIKVGVVDENKNTILDGIIENGGFHGVQIS